MFIHKSLWLLQAYACKARMNTLTKALLFLFLVLSCNNLFAEGSKDFRNYPGTRMWLDTRDDQQLKVYAEAGEYLNIGASHVGKAGGFIQVYRPDGTLHITYDGSGANPNEAIIFNSTQEDNGPNGGGTTNGFGYEPGVIQVQAGQEGVWTVIMDFPTYVSSFFNNLQNGDSWTRSANQPNFGRAILAWDISVSENAAGNNGGTLKEGRVYSNEFITLIQSNGNLTSPTLYVLTRDGFIYEVDINDADPYRFPISSSGIGFSDAVFLNQDQSQNRSDVIRSSEPETWTLNNVYFYEPQAQDTATFLVNNKIFFNHPDTLMPNYTETTDVFRSNPHVTWLRPELPELNVSFSDLAIESDTAGLDACTIAAIGYGEGGYFIFNATKDGRGVMQLDLNGNDVFGEPTDVAIPFIMSNGENVIFWDGNNGVGEAVPVGEYDIGYALIVRAGEVHITLADVENNTGGVTFSLLNGLGGNDPNEFYYDHTSVGGSVSGTFGTPGYAQPTTTPFTYDSNFGNNKLLDYWAYVNFDGNLGGTLPVAILPECGPFVENDNDEDGIPDNEDIDDDNDGVADILEFCNGSFDFSCLPGGLDPSHDADSDGISNYLDADDPAVNNPCVDANGNGICDDVLAIYDTDGDGVPDHFDLDSDNDGILDLVEAGHTATDANGDGIIDGQLSEFGLNGLYNDLATDPNDLAATSNYTPLDFDNDGVPDHDDLDSDNDGINDVVEAGWADGDTDNDGVIDDNGTPASVGISGLVTLINPLATGVGVPYPQDTDEDGVPDWHDLDSDNDGINDVAEALWPDLDNDGIIGEGIPTVNLDGLAVEDINGTPLETTSNPIDWDGDMVPDWHDLDSDNDGINDVAEAGFSDPDDDGIIGQGDPVVNTHGQATEDENGNPISTTSNPLDWDEDGVPDWHDLDSDNDGVNDVSEAGFSDPDNDGFIGTGIPNVNAYGQATENENGDPITTTSNPLDWDEDGVPDWHDLDSDNDGINDVAEAGFSDPDDEGIIASGDPEVNMFGQATEDENGDPIMVTSNPLDWDEDGVPDLHDLDSDNDGINDVEEAGFSDPDNDGIISTGSPVVNDDGQTTEDENGDPVDTTSNPNDWDGDGVSNFHDLDTDNDGINDVEEAGFDDPDNDGILGTGSPVVNDDGQAPGDTSNPVDTDEDGIPDYQDLDSDNDNINDVEEAGFDDPDNDGVVGTGEPIVNDDGQAPGNNTSDPTDTDMDGTPDYQELDSDDDGISDVVEAGFLDPDNDGVVGTGDPVVGPFGQPDGATSDPTDSDMDGTPDYQETDSDDDGLLDEDECPDDNTCQDWDMDGIPDFQDWDSDNDGIDDGYECHWNGIVSPCPDTDMDGFTNGCDLDSDGDGIPDSEECPDGAICPDADGNGIPEVYEFNCNANSVTANLVNPIGGGDYCEGAMINLSAESTVDFGTTIEYVWTAPDGTAFPTQTAGSTGPFILNVGPASAATIGTYTLVVFSPEGCPSDSNTPFTIEVGLGDIVGTTPVITTANEEVCEGDQLILNTTPIAGNNIVYTWSFTGTIIDEFTTSVAQLVIDPFTTANVGEYTVAIAVDGCESLTSDPIAIELAAVPQLSDVSGGGNYCEGDLIVLSATNTYTGNDAIIFEITNPNGSTDLIPAGPGNNFIYNLGNAATALTGEYTVVAQTSGACTSDAITYNINVTANPVMPILLASDDAICDNEILTLSTSDYGVNATYAWACDGDIVATTPVPTVDVNAGDCDYTVVVTVEGCASTPSAPVQVTIGQTPILTNQNGGGNYCEGDNITLSADMTYFGTSAVTCTITSPTGNTNTQVLLANQNLVINLGAGTTDMSGEWTVVCESNAGCTSNSLSFLLNIGTMPIAPIINAANTSICDNEPLELSTSTYVGNVSYTWCLDNATIATTSVPNLELSAPTSGDYTVSVLVNGCTSDKSAPIAVTIDAAPQLSNQNGGGNYCEGDNISLTADMTYAGSTAVNCTITSPLGNTSTQVLLANQDLVVSLGAATTDMSGEWTVVCESNTGCISNTLSFILNVGTMPVTPIINAANTSICDNTPLELSTSAYVGNVTYTWCLENATIATTNVPNLELATPLSGNYTVSVMVNGCTSDKSAPIAVTIDAAPELSNLNGSGAYCEGEMITFSTDVDYPNTGSITATITDPNNTTTTIVLGNNEDFEYTFGPATTAMGGSYTVSLESANGCISDDAIFNISVGAVPVTPTLMLSANELCEGEDLVLSTADYGVNAIYTWNGPGLTSPETPTNTFTVTSPQSGGYTVTVSIDGCTSNVSSSVAFVISTGVELGTITGAETALCEGEALQLSAMNTNGGIEDTNYTWTLPNGTEIIGMAPLAGPFAININTPVSGIYCLTVEGDAGCPDVTSCVEVTVNPKPEPPTLDIDDDMLCEGGLLELNATQYPGEVSYEWFFNGVSQLVTDVPTFFIDPVSAANDGAYSVIVTVDGCPSEPSNVQDLMVMATGNLDVTNSTDMSSPACEGESVNLSLTAIPGATYEWFGPNQFTSDIPNPTIMDAGTIDAGEYYAIVTTEFCTITTQVTAVFIEDADVSANDDSYIIEVNESLTGADIILNDGVTSPVLITIISAPSNGTATIQDGRLNYIPNTDYIGSDELQYEVCSAACPDVCAIATVTIRVEEADNLMPCDAPNIITPNNDGMNDSFSLPCLDTDDYPAANLKIFNRWGDKIFEEDGYKNTWSGEYKGRQTPTGTYYYLLQLDPNSEECMQGYFTLTR